MRRQPLATPQPLKGSRSMTSSGAITIACLTADLSRRQPHDWPQDAVAGLRPATVFPWLYTLKAGATATADHGRWRPLFSLSR